MRTKIHFYPMVLISLPLSAVIACGGDSKTQLDGSVDTNDARTNDVRTNCVGATALASYGAVAPADSDQTAKRDADTNPGQIIYHGKANHDVMFDIFDIELFKGSGTFSSGQLVAKTVDLGDPVETQYKTCGACFLIRTDVHPEPNGPTSTDDYMAKSGTLTITSISPFMGTITNAVLTHVTIDTNGFMSTPVGDCDVTLDSLTFNAAVTTGNGPQ